MVTYMESKSLKNNLIDILSHQERVYDNLI